MARFKKNIHKIENYIPAIIVLGLIIIAVIAYLSRCPEAFSETTTRKPQMSDSCPIATKLKFKAGGVVIPQSMTILN